MRKTISIAAALAAAALMSVGMSGCQSEPPSIAKANSNTTKPAAGTEKQTVDGVAATVDGIEITEQEVSDYVAQYRLYSNAEEDSAWATLLDESSMTPQTVRESAIRQIAGNKLLEKKAEELGINVSDSEISDIVSQHRQASDAVDDAAWKSLLDTTGYTEAGYRDDIRINVLSERVVEREMPSQTTPSEAELQDLAKEHPTYYTGKRTIAAIFAAGNNAQAAAFKSQIGDETSEKIFRDAASKEVDDNRAREVKDEGWSCLSTSITSYEEAAIANTHAGDVVKYADSDGTYRVVFIAEEYSTDLNGYPVLKNMPADIRSRLEDDCKTIKWENAIHNYVTDLMTNAKLSINSMPQGLPYDVNMELSDYGHETTQAEDEAVTQKLVNEHINELSISGYDSNGNLVSDALNASK